jgi:hypothetical protein
MIASVSCLDDDEDDVVLCNEQGCDDAIKVEASRVESNGVGHGSLEHGHNHNNGDGNDDDGRVTIVRERPEEKEAEPSAMEIWLKESETGQKLTGGFVLRVDTSLLTAESCASQEKIVQKNDSIDHDDDDVERKDHMLSLLSVNATFMEWALADHVAKGVVSYDAKSYGAHVYALGNDAFASVDWFDADGGDDAPSPLPHGLSWQVVESDGRNAGSNWLLLEWASLNAGQFEFASCRLFGIDGDVSALPPWLLYLIARADLSVSTNIWPQLAKVEALRRRYTSVRDVEAALFDDAGFWRGADFPLDGNVLGFDALLAANFLRADDGAALDRNAFARRFFALRRREALRNSITQSRHRTIELPERDAILVAGNEALWREADAQRRIDAIVALTDAIASGRLPRGFRQLASPCWPVPPSHPIAEHYSDSHFHSRVFCLLASCHNTLPNYVQEYLFSLDWAHIF